MKSSKPFTLYITKVLALLLTMYMATGSAYAQIPANDLCINAAPLTPAIGCTGTAGTLSEATISAPAVTGCNTPGADVWYSFVAQSAYPTVTLSGTGASLGTTNARIQLFSGACGSLTSLGCVTGNFLSTASVYPTGLTTGTTYYIRIYSSTAIPTGGAAWDFSICVSEPPASDLCTNAEPITSGATCTATPGTLNNAAISIPAVTTTCGTAGGDVWYSFVAQSVYPTVTLGSLGASLTGTNARIQLFSGSCGSLTSLGCVSGSILNTVTAYPTGLTPGNTYYVRVYSNTLAPSSLTGAWNFTICITDPPVNDLCSNAVPLTSGATCTATPGTLNYAAVSAPAVATTCGTAGGDVWYSFTAQSVYPTITLGSLGASLTGTNARIQLFSGTCASLTSLACVSNSVFVTAAAYPTGLTPGTTYYIRVYSNTLAPVSTSGAWDFSICVIDPPVNDLCANATPLTSANTCTNTPGTLNYAAISSPAVATTCGTAGADVWYSFVAQSVYPTITLSSLGASLAGTNARIQLFSGSCASLTSLACVSNSFFNTSVSYATGLVPGTTYYIRVYSNTAAPVSAVGAFDFSICVTDPPVNDDCVNALPLVSGATCNNITGTVASATYIASGATACTGTDRYDVWYTFVAQRTNPTITISSAGIGFITPRIQVLSGTCGAFTSVGCGTSTYTPTGLTVGNTYYVRVFSTNNPIPNINADFSICITDPPAPVNDNCSTATPLTSAAACANTAGTLLNATGTTGIPGDCGAVGAPEVWYSFVANGAFPTITLSGAGAQFTAAGVRLQLLSGSCGSFTSIACVSGNSINPYFFTGGTGLTIGNTYYIRVFTNSAIMSGTTWGFNICITDPASPIIDYGKSYVNITKGSGGGTIEPGDELEMRTTIAVRSNFAFNPSFTNIIPANTSYVPNTLRLLTNEGKIYKQWTDGADGDPATVTGTNVHFNLGIGATETLGGIINSTDRPVAGSRFMVIVSYRVIVGAVAFGTPISVGGGSLTYSNGAGTPTTINFPAVTALVYKNYGICTNTVGGNGILSENGGTFGSGNTKDRAPSANVPSNYTYAPFTPSAPGDYYYGLSNNTSGSTAPASYSIDPNDPVGAHRVFAVWDIIGDHTGAADPLAGNLPADVNNGQSGGYMVVINASYRTDTAFLDTVRNLCPNTSYEYSAWFRNVCRKCGIDSAGVAPSTVGYVPTGPGDSSGVHPNLTFNINGYDYYTTGDMPYTGQWVKKGFTYRTGPSETQMIINIRNNAPGGGGNDWAIDDIGVASCTPVLEVNPADPLLKICYADGASISAVVRSYFDNYTYYIWERSTDSGAHFTPTAFTSNGTISPVFNGSEFEYTAVGPSFLGDSSTHNNIFRLRVASSAGNLADTNCSFLAARTVKVYVNNCMWLLKTDFITTTGALQNNNAAIQWTTVNGSGKEYYEIEKSTDGIHFTMIGKRISTALNGNAAYAFTDPAEMTDIAYYRIKLIENASFKYSKTIALSVGKLHFSVNNLVNPFSSSVACNVIIPADGDIRATIFDMYGRAVKTYKQQFVKGVNPLKIQDLGSISAGTYFVKIEWQNESIIKKIIKSD